MDYIVYEKYAILIKNIKHYRQINKMTQEQLAEKADLSVSYIKQIELGHLYKNITFKTIIKISMALDVNISTLLTENEAAFI